MKKILIVFILLAASISINSATIPYDIVYLRAPRAGDTPSPRLPDVANPTWVDSSTDLILRHPNGTEEVLVSAGNGAVADPFISFDGQWCYYALFPDVRDSARNYQREGKPPYQGSDIWKINLQTKVKTQLTHQEFTPNTGLFTPTLADIGYGILNLSPTPVWVGGRSRIAFVSSRDGLKATKVFYHFLLRIYIMDEDGQNVTLIDPMSLGSALHPTQLMDGRLMFSSAEGQGVRDGRNWGLWSIWPDGRVFEPLFSAFENTQSLHFQTQLGNGDVIAEDYYNQNNLGFGAYYRFPASPGTTTTPPSDVVPPFGSPFPNQNPPIQNTQFNGDGPILHYPGFISFSPSGVIAATPWTHSVDRPSPKENGVFRGKVAHPSGAPGNDLLTTYTPTAANSNSGPAYSIYDAGIYIMPSGLSNLPSDLTLVVNSPNFQEYMPRAVVPYRTIYGIDHPKDFGWLPNDGSINPALPAGTPYALVGTSSMYKRDSFPGTCGNFCPPSYAGTGDTANRAFILDPFNTKFNDTTSNWGWQGADAGKWPNSEIYAIRLLALEPTRASTYGAQGRIDYAVTSYAGGEKMRVLGEIPLRKIGPSGPLIDPEGNPDTSFLARVPASTPITFQLIDIKGRLLTMAQTWHQFMPGEMRVDCGGCHAHSQVPLKFESTAAGKPGFIPTDLTTAVAVRDVEFIRDIRPKLQAKCISCHGGASPAANLKLDDLSLYTMPKSNSQLPGDYARLAWDFDAKWGYKSVINTGVWRQTNASRYVRMFQSRRSLLMWVLQQERSDGWANGDHPTESKIGDATTLPPGSNPDEADIDFIPSPAHSNLLTAAEIRQVALWIDLGAPIDIAAYSGHPGTGWTLDDGKPVLAVSMPRSAVNQSLTMLRVGVADYGSGIALPTLSITLDSQLGDLPATTNLASRCVWNDSICTIPLTTPAHAAMHASFSIKDVAGNISSSTVAFSVGGDIPPPTCTVGAITNLTLRGNQSITDYLTGQRVNLNGTLLWDTQPNAKRYELFVYRLPNGPNTQPEQEVLHVQDLIAPGQPITIASIPGTYKWTIRAGDNASLLVTPCGPWSTGSYSR